MKVLHVIDSLYVGGAENLVRALCVSAVAEGQTASVYVLRGGGVIEAETKAAGIDIFAAGGRALPGVYSPLHILRLARFFRSNSFDVIHVHLFPAQLWAAIAYRLSRCKTPILTTEHSTLNQRRNCWFRWIDRWMYRQFAAVAAISEATRHELSLHLGRNAPPISVVPNGVDVSLAQRHRIEARHRTQYDVLTIASLTAVKDHATLLRAVAEVPIVRVSFAGEGPLRSQLEQLASRLGILPRVRFLGVRRDIERLIEAADLYVQPSKWEGFCLAVVEAMSGGLPCIVARNSGLQEVVSDAGLYFSPGDSPELAARIRDVCCDDELRTVMSRKSVERSQQFSLKNCRRRYAQLYSLAIRKSRVAADGLEVRTET